MMESKTMDKKVIIQKIFFFRTLAADIIYKANGNRSRIDEDVIRYLDETPYSRPGCGALNYCLLYNEPFRNIFYYRTKENHILRAISRIFLKPVTTVEITGGEIGGGFRIDHNFCVVRPHKAGKNLTVRNGVTIGKGKASQQDSALINPVLGDDVDIYANAVIFGGIHIGNHVKIGAGAVVNKDVPDNCTVVGNPMRIILHEPNAVREGENR